MKEEFNKKTLLHESINLLGLVRFSQFGVLRFLCTKWKHMMMQIALAGFIMIVSST